MQSTSQSGAGGHQHSGSGFGTIGEQYSGFSPTGIIANVVSNRLRLLHDLSALVDAAMYMQYTPCYMSKSKHHPELAPHSEKDITRTHLGQVT